MTRPRAFFVSAGTLIHILGDDVTDDMVDVIGAAPEDEYLMYNGTSLIRLNRETPSGYDALKVSNAVDGLHIVKFDSTLYEVATNELAGYWVEINGKRAYVGSNTVDSLTLYTDHTKTRPSAFFVSAGTLIYILGDDVTDAMLGVIGAAPAGLGLGGSPKILTSADDLNTIWKSGWYIWEGSVPKNAPVIDGYDAFGCMCVDGGNSGFCNQTVFSAYPISRGIYVKRTLSGGVVPEWDYVNPPMKVGVEYRTTERCNGYTVYAKLITYKPSDTIGNTSGSVDIQIPHNISGFDSLVRLNATVFKTMPLPVVSTDGLVTTAVTQVNNSVIELRITKRTWNNAHTFNFPLYYTKA